MTTGELEPYFQDGKLHLKCFCGITKELPYSEKKFTDLIYLNKIDIFTYYPGYKIWLCKNCCEHFGSHIGGDELLLIMDWNNNVVYLEEDVSYIFDTCDSDPHLYYIDANDCIRKIDMENEYVYNSYSLFTAEENIKPMLYQGTEQCPQ